MIVQVRFRRIMQRLFILAGLVGASVSIWYYGWHTTHTSAVAIYDFKYERDAQFILDLFKNNMYWLVAEGSDFSPEHMLKNMAWSKEPQALGKQTIKVLYEGNIPAGFVAYHTINFYKGKLHFLAVDEKFRSKGYGLKLVNYAIKQLLKQGSTEIILVTRTNNVSAQSIYKKAGFKPTKTTPDGFVYFSYEPSQK